MPTLTRSEGSPLILVVDDDPAVAYAARAVLGRQGCRMESAFKGLDALARVRAGGVDALLLDVEMPETDGLSVLAALLDLPANPARPRVVLMSQAPTAAARAAVERGEALALLRKPVDFATALTLITGRAPEQPLQVAPEPGRPLQALVRDALEGKPLSLPGEAPLPQGTPINVLLPGGKRPVALTGTALAREGKGLWVQLLPLTPGTRAQLAELARGPALVAGVTRRPGTPTPEAPAEEAEAHGATAEAELPRAGDRASELYLRGLRRLDQARYTQALQDLSSARGMAPDNLEYQAAEKRAQQLAGAQRARSLASRARALALTEPREALQLLEEAIRLEPSRAHHHLEAAELWLQLGDDLERAEERLATAIHLAPSDPTPRLHFTRLLERAGRHLEALWACDAALALFPGDGEMRKASERIRKRLAALPQVEVAVARARRSTGA